MANEHNEIILTGLKGSHPLGALAAFGLLRCCAEMPELHNPRLHWQLTDDWLAVLTTENPLGADDLLNLFVRRMSGFTQRKEFNWADDIKTSAENFKSAAQNAVEAASPSSRNAADFFAAYGCELKQKDGNLKPTAFYMLSGNQKFFKSGLHKIALSLSVAEETDSNPDNADARAGSISGGAKKKSPEVQRKAQEEKARESFREALFGPWQYKDEEHPMGWDPAMERLYALRAKDPSPDKKNLSIKGAVWLAAEALSLFPCALVGNRLVTRGFNEFRRKDGKRSKDVAYFSWPLWISPLCLDAVRSVLGLKALTLERPLLSELRERGIIVVYRSHRERTGGGDGYYKIFRAAQPCIGGGANASH